LHVGHDGPTSIDVKVPLSRIFSDRAEIYRAMADSIRGEQTRAIPLKLAADCDRMADQAATLELEDADRAA
jgi:hypothetical protein